MPLPNFFIIGAPKAGTTGLYDTLSQHPEIYMSPVKEPCFFATERQPEISPGPAGSHLHRHSVWQPQEYLALFSQVSGEKAIGEASPMYLRSPLAAKKISRNIPHAKIIVILRHPIERAHSHYWHMVQKGLETEITFESALKREPQRIEDNWFSAFYYRENGFYFKQLSAYFDIFPSEQIKVYLYEDWRNQPRTFLQDVQNFLEISDQFVLDIRETNITRLPRIRRVHDLAIRSQAVEDHAMKGAVSSSKQLVRSALKWLDNRYNLAPAPPIRQETRQSLMEYYRDDIFKLQALVGRDLSTWLK